MKTARRSSEDIENQLRHIRRIIDKASAFQNIDYGSQLQMEALLAEEAQLVDHLKAARLLTENTVVQIALTGAPVVDHAVDIHLLGAFLLHLQEFIDALGQATEGAATQFGMVPNRVRRSNQLFATSLMPTSFGLNLATSDALAGQQTLAADQAEDVFDTLPDAIASLPDYFNGDAPLRQLSEVVSFPRVRMHYGHIVKLLSKSGASVELRTRRNPVAVHLTPEQANQRQQWIKMIQHDVKPLNVTGRLTGSNIRLRNFEIQADDGRLYQGDATEYATSALKRITAGSRVRANILETTERHGDTNVDFRQTFRLRLIEPEASEVSIPPSAPATL